MSHRTQTRSRRTWKERALSLLLTAAMALSLAPGLTLPSSAHWADEYLDQLVDWGVIRADQIGNPDAAVTRADFAGIVNRAYGYNKTGSIPFTDVQVYDWFYDDIAIAYNTGYMTGTSATTASPNATLTREQAVFILGKNMMMQETPGEGLAFSDSRNISTWARGIVRTAVDNYVVSGYPDNSFGPKDSVSKAQMAVLITQCIGTPVQEKGVHSLGGVFGNVTITSPGVTLRDTTISGDLYISGGVGLGGILLENVNVLGRIIVSGTGESEAGDASVVMRNVTADEMLVDNMKNQYVTIRADGITDIARTTVRTSAYLEDNNTDDKGLMHITLDGEDGIHLDLAGRIKEVVNKTPGSTVQVAKGSVQKLTVDEDAVNSGVQLDRNTEVKELNLDVATNVTGQGDIGKLNINAPGSNVAMLPDDIYIRPGITGIVNGIEMDSSAAEEVSRDPRILSGYPVANDVAPTGLQGLFSTNKRGTVYWAVSSISDGSIESDDLVAPPSYGSLAIQNGSVSAPAADTEVSAQISGLTTGGSYYLSAVLVDGQSRRSPVKVIAFTTPDSTVPAFAQGYPYMSLVTDTMAQVTVMPTKSCKLYYAVLPKGGQAPTANDMKTASVTGNLGYGVVDVVKNTERVINVSNRLEELKDYTLYLWLTDADGMNSSQVQALQFRTEDRTPPVFDPDPDPNAATETETSVTLTAGLNEAGTIYWAVVPEGQPYPLPNNQSNPLDKDNILDEKGSPVSAKLESEYAKLQVQNGRSATKRGSVAVRDANTDATINITGLKAATSYDLYYVAKDTAGNFSIAVKKITIRTADNVRPLVRQYFSNFQGDDETRNPMANSDVILEFSENVTAGNSRDLLTLYNIGFKGVKDELLSDTQAQAALYDALSRNFKLYQVDTATNDKIDVPEWDSNNSATPTPPDTAPWINYRNVVVQASKNGDGKIEVVFKNGSAVALASGSRYYFEITGIRDNANNETIPTTLNPKNCAGTQHVLDYFDTVFALVNLAPGDGVSDVPVWVENKAANNIGGQGELKKEGDKEVQYARVDTSFLVRPQSTGNSDPNIRYELALFTDAAVDYDLYYRVYDSKTGAPITSGDKLLPSANKPDAKGWIYLGNKETGMTEGMDWDGGAVNYDLIGVPEDKFPYLVNLDEDATYEFAVSVTEKDSNPTYASWSGQVNFRVYVLSSGPSALWNFIRYRDDFNPEGIDAWDTGVTTTSGRSIGTYGTDDFVTVRATFVDTQEPKFASGPSFLPGDTFVDVNVALDRPATIYYVVVPRKSVLETRIEIPNQTGIVNSLNDTFDKDGNAIVHDFWDAVKRQTESTAPGTLTEYKVQDNYPPAQNLSNPSKFYPDEVYGTFQYTTGGRQQSIPINNTTTGKMLDPLTEYYIYMVVKGNSSKLSEVYVYKFETSDTAKPQITLREAGGGAAYAQTQVPARLSYVLFTTTEMNKIPMLNTSKDATENKMSKWSNTVTGSAYEDMTVFDALRNEYNGSGYTVFDQYASEDAKLTLARYIRDSAVGNALTRQTVTTAAQGSIFRSDINHIKEMTPNTPYALLAVAHHVSSSEGSGDTFAALYNYLTVPDTTAPTLKPDGVTGNGRPDPALNPGEQPTANTEFKGTVTLAFDKPVYWSADGNGGGSALPVVNNSTKDPVNTNTATWVGILQDMGGNKDSISCSGTSTGPASSTFTLKYDGLHIGDSIILFDQGFIANNGGYGSRQKLTLTLTYGTPPNQSGIGIQAAYFVATWTNY